MFYDETSDYDEEKIIARTRQVLDSYVEGKSAYYSKYSGGDKNIEKAFELGIPSALHSELIAIKNMLEHTGDCTRILLVGSNVKTENYARFFSESVKSILRSEINVNSDMISILNNMDVESVLAIDDINEYSNDICNTLTQALETREVTVAIGKGSSARSVSLYLVPFTTIASVEDVKLLANRLVDAFDFVIDTSRFDLLDKVVCTNKYAFDLGLQISEDSINEIARTSNTRAEIKRQLMKIKAGLFEDKSIESNIDIHSIDIMNGIQFENFSKDLLLKNGFQNVTVTKSSGDYGADVIAEKDEIRYAIQCKRYNGTVGIEAVQEVIASRAVYKCHVGCVLTNSTFSPSALELAKGNLILMWDRDKLRKMMKC